MVLSYNITLAEALNRASVFLQEQGIKDVPIRDYWSRVFDQSFTEIVLTMKENVSNEQIDRFNEVLERLVLHEPIQYILGYTDFVGERYKVTVDTLIPREDTYGLITMAHSYLNLYPCSNVIDIGTGTGVIAIEVAKKAPQSQIRAVDLSNEALNVAKENALAHQVAIEFFHSDLMSAFPPLNQFDLIISNPPYISENELDLMDESVKRFEPKMALFAKENGLAIYKRLARELPAYLSNRGQILLEIGFQQANAVKALFEEAFPDSIVTVHQDLNQRNRYIKVIKKEAKNNGNKNIYK